MMSSSNICHISLSSSNLIIVVIIFSNLAKLSPSQRVFFFLVTAGPGRLQTITMGRGMYDITGINKKPPKGVGGSGTGPSVPVPRPPPTQPFPKGTIIYTENGPFVAHDRVLSVPDTDHGLGPAPQVDVQPGLQHPELGKPEK